MSMSAKISDSCIRLLKVLNFDWVRLFTFQEEIFKKLLLLRRVRSSPTVPFFNKILEEIFCQVFFKGGGESGSDQVCIEGCARPLARGMCNVIITKNILS